MEPGPSGPAPPVAPRAPRGPTHPRVSHLLGRYSPARTLTGVRYATLRTPPAVTC